MSKQKDENLGGDIKLKPAYKIQSWVRQKGFSANYHRFNGGIVVISKDFYGENLDPNTGQMARVVTNPSQVFINGKPAPDYSISGDLDMRIIFSLGQARVIQFTPAQVKEYNEYAKKLHNGDNE